jgi:hypothetical protein
MSQTLRASCRDREKERDRDRDRDISPAQSQLLLLEALVGKLDDEYI